MNAVALSLLAFAAGLAVNEALHHVAWIVGRSRARRRVADRERQFDEAVALTREPARGLRVVQ